MGNLNESTKSSFFVSLSWLTTNKQKDNFIWFSRCQRLWSDPILIFSRQCFKLMTYKMTSLHLAVTCRRDVLQCWRSLSLSCIARMFQRPSACSIFLKMESPPKMSHDSFTFRFPARLWRIINSCSTGAISWGPNGKTIRILRKKFEEEYLTGDAKPFKTAKYESFVRQLNHYGFKKVKKRSATKKVTISP